MRISRWNLWIHGSWENFWMTLVGFLGEFLLEYILNGVRREEVVSVRLVLFVTVLP